MVVVIDIDVTAVWSVGCRRPDRVVLKRAIQMADVIPACHVAIVADVTSVAMC